MKKFKPSAIAIACYVIAVALFVYFCFMAATTVSQINEYYAAYGEDMTPGVGEVLGYIVQNGLNTLVAAITIFMAGYILEAVRKLNPENYADAAAEVVEVVAEEAAEAAEEAVVVAEEASEAAEDVAEAAEETAEEAAEVVEVAEEAAEVAEEAAEKTEE